MVCKILVNAIFKLPIFQFCLFVIFMYIFVLSCFICLFQIKAEF